jgi:hypothetical protein
MEQLKTSVFFWAWCMPEILAYGRLRQKDCKFKASLGSKQKPTMYFFSLTLKNSIVLNFFFFLAVLEFELGLTLARQVLYNLSHASSPIL